jgi:hypothetical protein
LKLVFAAMAMVLPCRMCLYYARLSSTRLREKKKRTKFNDETILRGILTYCWHGETITTLAKKPASKQLKGQKQTV